MKNKKLLLLPIALFVLAGCGDRTSDDGSVTVKMSLMNSSNENPGWLAQIEKANELLKRDSVNVTIEPEIIKTTSWDEYYTKISANMAARVGGTIGRIAESHIPLMIDKKQLQDLTPIATELIESGEYNTSAFGGVAKVEDKIYGLPSGTQHMLLYYNKDLFDAKGLQHPSADWENPSTFEEIKNYAKQLSSGEGANRKFGLSAGPFLSYAGMYAVNSGGENIFNDQGQPVINTEAFYNVYEWFDTMLKVDRSMPTTADTQTASAIDRFLSGNIAMFVDGVWQLHDIIKYTEFNVGIAAIPVLNENYDAVSTTFTDRYFAVRSSKNQEADQTALKYLMKAESIQALAAKSIGGFPVYDAAVTTYTQSLSDSKLSEYVPSITEGRNRGVFVPYSSYYNQVDQRINQKMSIWIEGGMTAREFVDFMQETMIKGMEGKL